MTFLCICSGVPWKINIGETGRCFWLVQLAPPTCLSTCLLCAIYRADGMFLVVLGFGLLQH